MRNRAIYNMHIFNKNTSLVLMLFLYSILISCKPDRQLEPGPNPVDGGGTGSSFDINSINDTYHNVTAYNLRFQWGPYNVHDPAILNDGEWFYSYSTDAGYGVEVPPGVQIRRSKDLIEWHYVGTVFNGLPQMGANFITQNGGVPFNSLWAPYAIKVGSEYRLYYSLSSGDPTARLSVIGLATSSTPTGPWVEKGLVVTSLNNNRVQTNAIDPTVIVDEAGNHWFYYGSAWDGIYMLKLNPATGLAENSGDKGRRIAQRGFTGNRINGNIEGPEIIYNSELKKYYLFIAYDWIDTKYNVRVGRSDSPEGPFLDFNDRDVNGDQDNIPMILAPYKFEGHSGWQGVSHPGVFKDGNRYFMAHQGRPGVDKFFMIMHVRQIFWTEDGWPIVSPQRYAGVEQTVVPESELAGEWEQIVLGYRVVPGYANEQVSPDFQEAFSLRIGADGSLNGNAADTWTYNAPWLELKWSNGFTDKVHVSRGRDWEKRIEKALVFTGLNNEGTAVWGKKKQ
jgi:arabinan endo-1,5-alpha-L-arabinosidase